MRPVGIAAVLTLGALAALGVLGPSASADDGDGDDGTNGRVVRVIHNPPGDAPILGPRYAAVTIEYFFNLDNSGAEKLHEKLVELARRHPLRLRLVYRPALVGVDRYNANSLAIEAARQGLFHEFITEFFRQRRPRREALEKLAKEVGIDWPRFQEARQRNSHKSALFANFARAARFKINSPTASILVNGEPFPRPRVDLDTLEILYDTAFAKAKEILDLGYPVSELYKRILVRRMAAERIPRITVGQIDGRDRRPPKKNAIPLAAPIDYRGPHSAGANNAPVVIVSFCRFASRNCATQRSEIERAMSAFEGQVRHVFKPFYDAEADPHERKIHLAAECAADQGAFWEYLRIASGYANRLQTNEALIRKAFTQLSHDQPNLDDSQFTTCLSDERHADRVNRQVAEASRVGVKHSPSTVIGSRIYIGRPQASNLMRLIELELAPGLIGGWLEDAGR